MFILMCLCWQISAPQTVLKSVLSPALESSSLSLPPDMCRLLQTRAEVVTGLRPRCSGQVLGGVYEALWPQPQNRPETSQETLTSERPGGLWLKLVVRAGETR